MQTFLDSLEASGTNAAAAALHQHPDLLHGRNPQGSSWLAVSINGRADIAQLFLDRGVEPDLHESVMLGMLPRVKSLLANGANIDAPAPDGFTPLALAVFFGHDDVFRFLLEQGANIHLAAHNPMKVTALHAAAARGNVDAVQLLLARGADPNARQQSGFTPLHTAAQNGRRDLAELLLSHHAAPSLANDDGILPADLAAKAGHADLAALLRPPD